MEKKAPAASPSTPAALRWSILRRALLSASSPQRDNAFQMGTKNISRKTASGFNLIPCHPLNNDLKEGFITSLNNKGLVGPMDVLVCYQFSVGKILKLILIKRKEDYVDLNDFEISARYNIDTTGLVCSWPTEDVLTYFCANNPKMFRSKRVLELGSGYGLAGLAIAAITDACEVVISDGNPQVIDYIQRNIIINSEAFGGTEVKSWELHWTREQASDVLNSFDIIVASDCTFFKEFHDDLARTVKSLLKCTEDSVAIFLSPRRGDSLNKFLQSVKETGMHFQLIKDYNSKIRGIHERLQSGEDPSWPNYVEDHCYPLMVKIKVNNAS